VNNAFSHKLVFLEGATEPHVDLTGPHLVPEHLIAAAFCILTNVWRMWIVFLWAATLSGTNTFFRKIDNHLQHHRG
jgi:hypothetical protein